MPPEEVKIDREFASLIPPLSPDELGLLRASLAAEGLREPLLGLAGEKHSPGRPQPARTEEKK